MTLHRARVALFAFFLAGFLISPSIAQAMDKTAPLKVEIKGLSGELLDNVRAHLGIEKPGALNSVNKLLSGRFDGKPQTEAQVRRFYREAPELIRQALQALGHYRSRVTRSLQWTGKEWQMAFTIDPGPAINVAQLDLEILGPGKDDPLFRKWLEAFPLRDGSVLNQGQWEKQKSTLLNLARDHGYLDARLTAHRIEVNKRLSTAQITLKLETGTLYHFGRLFFRQQPDVLNTSLLERYEPFKEGDRFENQKLVDLQTDLLDSGYFSDVELNPERQVNDGDVVPVTIDLKPAKRYRLVMSIGYSTDTGPEGQARWTNRRLNRNGHRLSASASASQVKQSANIDYAIPLANPLTQSLHFGLTAEHEDTNTVLSDTLRLGAAYSYKPPRGWGHDITLDWVSEDYEVGGLKQSARLIVPGIQFFRQEAKGNPLMPDSGWRLGLGLRGGIPLSGSDSFIQGDVEAKLIQSLGDYGRVLLRGKVGATEVKDLQDLPASYRYYTGGAESIRGFRYQSVGPRNEAGDVIGGSYLAVGSVEYQYPVSEQWYAAVFADSGGITDSVTDFAPASSAGVGAIWVSPVGPIRIYLAYPIAGEGRHLPLAITMGADL